MGGNNIMPVGSYYSINLAIIINTNGILTVYKLLQIGDFNEIMYFKARSEIERIDWMEAIRVGIIISCLPLVLCIIKNNTHACTTYTNCV